ncbi:hypothetical protein K488DRAFT_89295 [Vararia minispora EC-137]|uniref:Uncharacterized protein n=1 Tax=Vararia minispora EC-137 TaxID=1314806 RepID=A0ACB8QBF3_9AGAM|nr:hypothetical protein K488DRAFT_89295 [Vararia minispora EC-137]
MSTNQAEDAIAALDKVVGATPDLVSPTRWENWKLWKQAADTAEEELKKQIAKATHSSISEEFWQLSDRTEKALQDARKSFTRVERMVEELQHADQSPATAADTVAAISSAQQQAASRLGVVNVVDAKPEIAPAGSSASHVTSPLSVSAPIASSSTATSPVNGGLPKTPSGKGQQPVIFDPPCDNCRGSGSTPCVRSPPPHHRRCTRCAESNMRCSFKEAKATAAAAQAAAHADGPGPSRTLGKRKRFTVADYDEDASYMLVKTERRASVNGTGPGALRQKVQEAQNLVRTIGFLFEKLDDALEDIAEAAGVPEESMPA